ncbi:S-adenosyl-L-methionine-dependent methyltransferase [Melampsora americana]|nr:S-adenosyl-L-methionine-dependent methyltransferase [Melampsora americana]
MGKGKKQTRNNTSSNGTISVKPSTQRWDALPATNEAFVNYYKSQGIVANDKEWDELFAVLRTDLPTTFRITGTKKNAVELSRILKEVYVPFLSNVEISGQSIPPPAQIPWYPDGLAWELRASKHVIRKSPEFKKFQNFLVYETEAGNISRQEAVSMVPTLLLDVQPQHFVFDACAAPGSKTAQLVENLHSSKSLIPPGLLIANDSDYKRSHLLVHQSLRRLPSPSTMITNHDASMYPSLKIDGKPLLFDRILCDVPCSGDGTLRKNGGIWRDWTPANGIGLHGLQMRILSRCIALLKPGGRMVYSTCSLNPLENEAVLSAVLNQHPEMSLVDVSDRLPELKRRPGMTTWKVMNRNLGQNIEVKSLDDLADDPNQSRYSSTLWPDGKEKVKGLQRCLRIYPHLQNTGGFFVAVLVKAKGADTKEEGVSGEATETPASKRSAEELAGKKSKKAKTSKDSKTDDHPKPQVEESKIEKDQEPAVTTEDKENGDVADVKKSNQRHFKEDPYTYIKADNAEVKHCIKFFAIKPNFPVDNLLVRNASGEPSRTIYMTSPIVRKVIESNPHDRLRLMNCGVKLFGKDNSNSVSTDEPSYECRWRIVSDGVGFCKPFMGSKRVIKSSLKNLKQLISNPDQYPLFEDLEDKTFKKAVQKIGAGSCVMEVIGKDDEQVPKDLVVAMWISKASVNLMVDKKERKVISMRLWDEDLTVNKKVKDSKKEQEE